MYRDEKPQQSLEDREAQLLWQYFSTRADQSGNYVRIILFASANAGFLFCLSQFKACGVDECERIFWMLAPAFLFVLTICFVLASWFLQKQKGKDRRADVRTMAANKALIDELEKVMDGVERPAKENVQTAKKPESPDDIPLRPVNKIVDHGSFWLLGLAYFVLTLVALI